MQNEEGKFREESDSLGTIRLPKDAYYGASTQRAVDNFPISGLRFPAMFTTHLGLVKKCAALVNLELGLLDPERAEAIAAAAQEVMDGKFDAHFVVDVFQTGSGTSTNMNANEVIASRANELLTGKMGGKTPVHPNDHVNLGQSSNDIIPTVLHISTLSSLTDLLIPSLARLEKVLGQKAMEFSDINKIGRTHLQDAVPLSLGQEFSGYARQMALGIQRIRGVEARISELPIGGTAVGNGLNTHPEFARRAIALISDHTNLPFREAENHFEAQAARDAAVETSGVLKTIAAGLVKIANDVRWLASGPRCGLGEVAIPSLQPGSSIMPGKINPVIPEAVIQVAAQVAGNDTAIMIAGQSGNFELNAMVPVITYNLLQSIALLAAVSRIFADKCIAGIMADREVCASNIEKSLALATLLVPHTGYDKATKIAKKAVESGKTIREIVLEDDILGEAEFNKLLDE